MKKTFLHPDFGLLEIVKRGNYADGTPCVGLIDAETREPVATLSVCTDLSAQLPIGFFYVKDWSENELVVHEAAASGWFEPLSPDQFEPVLSGFVCIDKAWRVRDAAGAGFSLED